MSAPRARSSSPESLGAAIAEKERLLRVLRALEESVEVEPDEDFSFASAPATEDSERAEPPPEPLSRARVVLAIAMAALTAIGIVAVIVLFTPPSSAAAAPRARLDTYFAVQVVSRMGEINAHTGDRCVVDLRLAREGECRMDIVCPGVEKHTSSPACAMPEDGARVEAHWQGIDFDGEVLSFIDTDEKGEGRGIATARIDVWRR